jgi:hypothetical protein
MTDAVALAVSRLRPGMIVIFIMCLIGSKPQEVATPW